MELEDEIMFDLDAYLEASDMTGSGLSALRCRSCRSRFSTCQARAEAYTGKVDDSINDTYLQDDLKRHPFAQVRKG